MMGWAVFLTVGFYFRENWLLPGYQLYEQRTLTPASGWTAFGG
jgi:hypothetical protein